MFNRAIKCSNKGVPNFKEELKQNWIVVNYPKWQKN